MTFADLQNLVLWRLRQRGVNFGAAPTNAGTDFDPPYVVALLINEGYAEFLSRTQEQPIAALKVQFPTNLNATSYALNPIPPDGATINPAALRIYEATYIVGGAGGMEYRIPLVSTQRFRSLAGAYTRRIADFGPRVLAASQLFGRNQLDVLPGTATAGDLITLTVCPDVTNSPNVTAANGGQLVNAADVPIIPGQFHMALAEYAIANAAPAADKAGATKLAGESFEAYVQRALEYGATRGEGDPELRVSDVWEGSTDPSFILGGG